MNLNYSTTSLMLAKIKLYSIIFIALITSSCSNKDYLLKDWDGIFLTIENDSINRKMSNISINMQPQSKLYFTNTTDYDTQHSYNNYKYNGNFSIKTIGKIGVWHNYKNNINHNGFILYNNKIFFIDHKSQLIESSNINVKQSKILHKIDNNDNLNAYATLHNNKIISVLHHGIISVFDLDANIVLWTKKLNFTFHSSPLIKNDIIYINGDDDKTIALDLKDGSILWQYNGNIVKNISLTESPKIISYNDMVISVAKNGEIVSLDLNGNIKWKSKILPSKSINYIADNLNANFTPIIVKNILIIGGYRSSVMGLNVDTGRIIWQANITLNSNIITNNEDFIFFFDNVGKLIAMNIYSGQIKWINDSFDDYYIKKTPRYLNYGNEFFKRKISRYYPMIINDKIYFNDILGSLYCINPNSGEVIDKIKITYMSNAPLVVTENKIYLMDNFYFLHSLE